MSALIPYCRYHLGGFYVRVELNSWDNRESDYTVIWMEQQLCWVVMLSYLANYKGTRSSLLSSVFQIQITKEALEHLHIHTLHPFL
jgi:hypothetical protein